MLRYSGIARYGIGVIVLSDKRKRRGEYMDVSKLFSYIRAQKPEIADFSREITLIDYGLTNAPAKFVTEISIPVK